MNKRESETKTKEATMATYKITRYFTTGFLKGLTHTETTTVRFEVGREYGSPFGGGRYIITEVLPL